MRKILFIIPFFLWTCSSPTKSDNPPVASFSADQLSGIEPLIVQFQSTSTGDITSYNWNFGNGTTSSLENPQVTFNEGTFTITLNLTGPDGSSSKLVQDMISVSSSAPISENINVLLDEDNQASISLISSDPKDKSLAFSIVDNPSNGSISLSENLATYIPDDHFNGQDSFTYRTFNGEKYSNTALVNISITPIDDDPYTNDIDITIDEDNSIQIALSAEEYDGDNIYFQINSNPSFGNASLSNNTVNYVPNENYYGNDSFTYEAFDANSKKKLNEGTVSITINPVNDPPTQISSLNLITNENESLQYQINVVDVDGDELVFETNSDPFIGTVTFDSNILNYEPNQDIAGEDNFTIKVSDQNGGEIFFDVGIEIIDLYNVYVLMNKNSNKEIKIYHKRDDVEVSYIVTSNPVNGNAVVENDSIKYIPDFNYTGYDSLIFSAYDGEIYSHKTKIIYEVNQKLGFDGGVSNRTIQLLDGIILDDNALIHYTQQGIINGLKYFVAEIDRDGNKIWETELAEITGSYISNYHHAMYKINQQVLVESGKDISLLDQNGNIISQVIGNSTENSEERNGVLSENKEYFYQRNRQHLVGNGDNPNDNGHFYEFDTSTLNETREFYFNPFNVSVWMLYADQNSFHFLANSKIIKTDKDLNPIWAINSPINITTLDDVRAHKDFEGNFLIYCTNDNSDFLEIAKYDSNGNILIGKTELLLGFNGNKKTPITFDSSGNIITVNSAYEIFKFDSNFNEIWNSNYTSYTSYVNTVNFQDYNFYQFEESHQYIHGNNYFFINISDDNEMIFGGVSKKRNDASDYDNDVGTLLRSKRF